GPVNAIVNPVFFASDKQHGRIAVESWDAINFSGGLEFWVFQTQTNATLEDLGIVPLSQEGALRFHPNGRWIYSGPGAVSFWDTAQSGQTGGFDLSQGLSPVQSSQVNFGFGASDS